jgi:hypothetical protein
LTITVVKFRLRRDRNVKVVFAEYAHLVLRQMSRMREDYRHA